MKNTMKKLITIALAALMVVTVLSMTACSGPRSLDDIKKAGTLVVYTEAAFAPYEFYYENKVVGVDVKIMEEVAKELGVTLEVKDVAFDTICASVKTGKADIGAAGITINDTRKETVDFSIPYSSTEQYVVVAKANTTIKNVDDLKGKVIGVQQGTTSDSLLDSLIKDGTLAGSTLTPYNSPAIAAASIGKIDAVVTDKLTAETIVAANGDSFVTFKLTKADGSDVAEVEEYGIAVAKGNSEILEVINKVVKKLLDDGSIEKWTQEYSDLYSTLPSEN